MIVDSLEWLWHCVSAAQLEQNPSHLCVSSFPLRWPVTQLGSYLDSPTVLCCIIVMRSPGSPQHHYINLLFPLDALSILDLSCSALVCSHFECDSVPTGEHFLMHLSTWGNPGEPWHESIKWLQNYCAAEVTFGFHVLACLRNALNCFRWKQHNRTGHLCSLVLNRGGDNLQM